MRQDSEVSRSVSSLSKGDGQGLSGVGVGVSVNGDSGLSSKVLGSTRGQAGSTASASKGLLDGRREGLGGDTTSENGNVGFGVGLGSVGLDVGGRNGVVLLSE